MFFARNFSKAVFRKSFSNNSDREDIPYLISLQRDSYAKLLQLHDDPSNRGNFGLQSVFNSFFPVSDSASRVTVEFVNYFLGDYKYDPLECISSGGTYCASLYAQLRLILWQEDGALRNIASIKEQSVYFCDIPLMTENGSFVINGAERVVVSQMHRAPGVFFDSESSKSSTVNCYSAKIVPHVGSWVDFEFDSKDIIHFRVDKKRKIPATSLLRAIGMSSEAIITKFYDCSVATIYDGVWVMKFDATLFIGKKLSYDLLSTSGEIKIKQGTKITQKIANKLVSEEFSYYLLNDDSLLGYVFAQDLIEEETGEFLLEAGSIVTLESLEILQGLSFSSVNVVNPSKSDIGPYIYNTLLVDKNTTQKDCLFDIYKACRLGESPSSIESARLYLESLFFSGTRYSLSDVGRMKMNHRLGLEIDKSVLHLTKEDIERTITVLSSMRHNESKSDDIDNLANRRLRAVGELVEAQVRAGMTKVEKSIVEKLNSSEPAVLMPHNLINSKPLITAIKDFFSTSQLSQFMDQTNPLSEVTHKRRLSALGPGGLTRERAGFEVRDVHPTHYGRICPIETPEGPNIGLINSLAVYARVNDYGFIETPYYKVTKGVVTKEMLYLSAMEEVDFAIAPNDSSMIDSSGRIISDTVNCRRNGEYISLSPDKIDFMDISTKQIVSIATTMIPFLENDDANRALMGSNMQRQAVPLLFAEPPIVGTGMESVVALDSGAVVLSKRPGVVKFVDASKVIVEVDGNLSDIDVYNLKKYTRTNQDTCANQRPAVFVGDTVETGSIIAEGYGVSGGEIALGKNVRVAFMPWNGYNFEDSIVISEELLVKDVFTSIHIEELEVVARDTRLGPEEITRDIPNVNEELLSKLDEDGIVQIGVEVRPGDLLVGKTTPKSESPMTPEEKLLKVIFGEKSVDVRDSSLYVPTGVGGTVVDVKIFSRKGIEKDERSIFIEMQQINRLTSEKKLKVSFLEKSTIRKIESLFISDKISAFLDTDKKKQKISSDDINSLEFTKLKRLHVADLSIMKKIQDMLSNHDFVLSSIENEFSSKISRLRVGDGLGQGVLKVVKVFIASKYRLQPGDKMAGRHGNKGVVSKIVPIEDMPYSEDGRTVDIVLNPLGVPSRMNFGQVLETHLGFASKEVAKKIDEELNSLGESSIANLKKTLSLVYSSEWERPHIDAMSPDQILSFCRKLSKQGVYFATGIFEGFKESYITNLLNFCGADTSAQVVLHDGKTGEPFSRKVTVGYIYMLKLHHLVDNKIHARSTGPYSLITQQPLGGKSKFGGQRFGEMECWALQAFGAAYTLQEMLTVKSDDVVGRIRMYESIMQGSQSFNCGIPESFNVMIKEVRSLGLNIELIES